MQTIAFDYSKAYLLKPNEKPIEIVPENKRDFKLPELYRQIGCGLIQVIAVSGRRIMILDEEGKLKESNAVNPTATMLSGLYPHDVIVGTAIICPARMLK